MPNRTREVDRFIDALEHPLKEEIARLRLAILDSSDRIGEHVKWNAPSFAYAGEDRVTFRLFPENRTQLVFHRGSKVKPDAGEFAFGDETGLLRWVAKNRAVVALRDEAGMAEMRPALVGLVNRWVVA